MNIKAKIIQAVWLLLGVGVMVLFCAAMITKNKKNCSDIKIEITGAEEHLFIDEKDVLQLIAGHSDITNRKVSEVDLRGIETELKKTPWVKNAELYFDNKQILQVRIIERQPIARVFTVEGNSFYVDTAVVKLPLSEKLSARVPMFTNFPSDSTNANHIDTVLLKGVVAIGKYIMADSFWNAQIQQVYITPKSTFQFIPTIGDQLIEFGTATDVDEKFSNLFTFYKKAWVQNGINTYSKLDLSFKNQVVGLRKDAAIVATDSAKAKAAIEALMKGNNVLAAVTLTDSSTSNKTTKVLMDKKKLGVKETNNNKRVNNSFSIVKKSKVVVKKAKHPIKKEAD